MTPPTAPRGCLPWNARPAHDSAYEWDIVNADGWKVAEVIALGPPNDPLPAESNAALICQAVNAFTPLVEALAAFLNPEDGHAVTCRAVTSPGGEGHRCQPRCARARAALKLARGET